MSNGKLHNQFIEFESDLELLTDSTAIRNIYVRESYETVTTLISDAIKMKVKRFVVTGTPGIGKTVYLHYFLWVLFTKQTSINNNVQRKIYLQRMKGRIISFRGNKVVSIDAGAAEDTILCDSKCILLVDMVEEKEPARCSGTTIIFSSPNPKRYKQLMNGVSRQYILNPWTLAELNAVWLHSYPDIPWEDVERLYNKMGGIIRYVLEQNDVADKRMETGIRKAKNMFITMSQSIDEQFSSGKHGVLIYRVAHIFLPDHSIDNSKYVFASNYAQKECLKGLKIEERDRVLAFLKYNTAMDAQGYRGYLFEVQAHEVVAARGLSNITRLTNAKYEDKGFSDSLRSYALPSTKTLSYEGSISKIPTIFDDLSTLKIVKIFTTNQYKKISRRLTLFS